LTFPEFYSWLSSAGFPGLLSFLLYLSMTGQIRWSREMAAALKDEVALRAEYEADKAELRADRDWWRDKALSLMDRWGGEIATTEAAAKVASRVMGRR
jgi:hypothetical protein